MNLTQKIAVAAGALTLAATGAAAALESPEAATSGLANAATHTGFAVPVGAQTQDEVVDETTTTTTDDEATDEADAEDSAEDNHGAAVSAVAQSDFETGREHGAAVSEVARSDAGKPATGDDDELDDEDESGDEAPESGDDAGDDDEETGAESSAPTTP